MSEKYEVGLSRNRVYEPFNAIVFCGKYNGAFDLSQANKAMKMLIAKEPVITCALEMQDDAKAYLVAGVVSPDIAESDKTKSEIVNEYENNGIDASEGVFRFCYSSDGYFVIVGHIVVCDYKSLLRLAKAFVLFYERKNLDVEPMPINTFPGFSALPVDIASPITDKLSAELESKWGKKVEKFTREECETARNEYRKNQKHRKEISVVLSAKNIERLKAFCEIESVDLSSVIGFCFNQSLVETLDVPKKSRKWVITSDRRFFLHNAPQCSVGAFDGSVEIPNSKKISNKPLKEQLKAFHLNCYKGVTSVFRNFYDDVLLMKLSPEFTDSAYMYMFGKTRNKASQRLAENYGCKSEKMCGYFSCNLGQSFWAPLKSFGDVSVSGGIKSSYFSFLIFLYSSDGGTLTFKFNPEKISEEIARKITENALGMLEEI